MYPPNMASSSAGIPQDAQMNANNNINPPATGVPVVDYNTHNYNYNYNYNYTPAMNNNNNNVPHHQPYIAHTHAPIPDADNKVEWSTGLFDCFSDFQNCFITFWCPCITFGQIAEIVDKGSTSCGASGALYTLITCVIGTGCIYSCFYRSKMRRQYMLEESPCWDWLVHSCCEPCALCQEYRELHNRGFDMLIGWQGNVERRNYPATAVMMTPTAPPLETMNR